MSEERELTSQEYNLVPFPLDGLGYHTTLRYFFGTFGSVLLSAEEPEGPWTLADGTLITPENFISNLPNSNFVSHIDLKALTGTFNRKAVRFSKSRGLWVYQNNHPISFPETHPSTPEPTGPSHLPTPQTAGPSTRPQQPASPSPRTRQNTPVQPPTAALATNVPPAPPIAAPPRVPPVIATPKLVGNPPEAFDGKPDKAETFLSQLDNYYYLNDASFMDESRRVSATLTHFKAGTSAGKWAQDRTTTALTANPRSFGTWAAFKAAFKAHFIPADSQLEAGALMHSLKQGQKPFNEWYQTWYTHASQAGVDKATKMFAFHRNLNQALHNKLLTISPQPNTLTALVEKARQFDQLYQLYNSPTFTQQQPGARIRTANTAKGAVSVNFSSTTPPSTLQRGPLSKEERDRRFREKLCLYCGRSEERR